MFVRHLLLALLAFQIPLAAAAEFPDRLVLRQLLLAGDYEALEAEITGYQRGYESGALPEDRVELAFRTFDYAGPAFRAPLDQWIERMPRSYAALAARGMFNHRLGWAASGSAFAKDTSDEQVAAMRATFEKAISDLIEALKLNERLSTAYGVLIVIAMAEGRQGLKEILLKAGLTDNPDSRIIREEYLLSLQPKWGGSFGEMGAFLAETVHERPKDVYLQALQGFLYLFVAQAMRNKGDREGAIEALGWALSRGEHWRFLDLRAWQNFWLQRYDQALADFDRLLQIRPRFASALQGRARVLLKQGNYDRALVDLDVAVRMAPRNASYLRHRALALKKLERLDAALADLDKAVELAPDNKEVRYSRGYFYLYDLKQPARALADLKRATELDPKRHGYWFDYGAALFDTHDCAFVAAFRTYRKLCESGKPCRKDRLKWADMAIRKATHANECPG